MQTLIPKNDLLGKWHDIVFNAKWSLKQDGFLKMWINGKLVYHYIGSNLTPREKEGFQFGIYRGPNNGTPKEATQVAYYDEIRYAKKKCEKLKLEDLGYSCSDLVSQTVSRIDTIDIGYIAVIKSKDNGNYLLKVSAVTKKLTEKKDLMKCKEAGNTGCYVHYSGPKPQY